MITHKGIKLSQPQLDAIIPVLNRRPMPRGKRFERLAEAAMTKAGYPLVPLPDRVQRKRRAGFRLPPNTTCVDRTTGLWGNPFVVGRDAVNQEEAVRLHLRWLENDPMGRQTRALARLLLPGKNLACFCEEGRPCHADNLITVAAGLPPADFTEQIQYAVRRLRQQGSQAETNGRHRHAATLFRRAHDYAEAFQAIIPPPRKTRG